VNFSPLHNSGPRHVQTARAGRPGGAALCAGLALAVSLACVEVAAQNAPPGLSGKAPVARAASNGAANGAVNKADWSKLTPAQQAALQPLAGTWSSVSEPQKRKWIVLSRNFQTLSPAERATLHSRMTEWANLSAVQRSQARLNFAQTQDLSPAEKKAQWDAYQALSPEQKQQLAAGGQLLPSGAAPALKPVDPTKLAAVPVTRSDASSDPRSSQRKAPARETGSPLPRVARAASAPANGP